MPWNSCHEKKTKLFRKNFKSIIYSRYFSENFRAIIYSRTFIYGHQLFRYWFFEPSTAYWYRRYLFPMPIFYIEVHQIVPIHRMSVRANIEVDRFERLSRVDVLTTFSDNHRNSKLIQRFKYIFQNVSELITLN